MGVSSYILLKIHFGKISKFKTVFDQKREYFTLAWTQEKDT